MKVGMIIHSHTGNTLSVAQRLKELLESAGHEAILERVTAVNEVPSAAANVQLKEIPDISCYDFVIFGAPVRAFSLSPVMKPYLSQLGALQGKKVSCFVTQHFPFAWMGGNNAIGQMKKALESKGAKVLETGVVNWTNKKREDKISEVLARMTRI